MNSIFELGQALNIKWDPFEHSRIGHNFEAYLIKVLEIMAEIWQYIFFKSLKPIKVSSDFILNYLKKVVGGATSLWMRPQD